LGQKPTDGWAERGGNKHGGKRNGEKDPYPPQDIGVGAQHVVIVQSGMVKEPVKTRGKSPTK